MKQWELNLEKVDKVLYEFLKGRTDGLIPPECIDILTKNKIYPNNATNKVLAFRNDLRELEKRYPNQEVFFTTNLKIDHTGGKYARWHIYRRIDVE